MKDIYYKRLLDNASDLIWAMDLEGKIIYVNGRISEWGYDKDEMIGRPLLNILNITHMGKKVSEPAEPGVTRKFDMQLQDNRGRLHRVVVSSSPLQDDDGQIVGMMGIIHDVTQTHNLEEKLKHEERLASLGRLATGIAHEIRNPLSSVKMNLDILSGRLGLAGRELEHFAIAREEVANLERIVTEFLDYAKPTPLTMGRHNLSKVVEETVAMARPYWEESGVTISRNFGKNIPTSLFDKGKIQQALLNVLINAIQASKNGGMVEIETTMASPNSVEVVVGDHGEGISDANLKFVFDPFFTTKQQGTGLGLSIVSSIMKNHGGSISMSTKFGEGTRVSLEFPVR